MTKILYNVALLISFVVSINICSAQDLSKSVRNDFCKNALFESKYGNDSFKAVMNIAVRNSGANTYEGMVTSIENICNNYKLQDEFFRIVYSMGRNRDMVFMQFSSIGMKPDNATKLTDYILKKYDVNTQPVISDKKEQTNITLSTDIYEDEPAIIKTITLRNNVYILVDIVQIKYFDTNENGLDYEIVNQNTKLRAYKVIPNPQIKNSDCLEVNTSNYLIDNKNKIIKESPFGFVLISTNNKGELTKINLGCWN